MCIPSRHFCPPAPPAHGWSLGVTPASAVPGLLGQKHDSSVGMRTRSGFEPSTQFPPEQVPFLEFMYFGSRALFSALASASVLKVLSGLSSANTPPQEHALCSVPKHHSNLTDGGNFCRQSQILIFIMLWINHSVWPSPYWHMRVLGAVLWEL